jgi:hypothetical protein
MRGTFITLSHFCPTAASALFREDVELRIVRSPAAFPRADYEGLVAADDDLPPLLRPGMLADFSGYSAWERHMVSLCADERRPPESVLATLRRDAALVRTWKPGARSLEQTIAQLPAGAIPAETPAILLPSLELYEEAMRAVPDELKPEPDTAGLERSYRMDVRERWPLFTAALNRYLAAKAFASWTAYQGRGLATIVRGLEAALAIVRVEASRQCRDARRPLDRASMLEAFRSADFLLNHLAVGEDLAEGWSRVEKSR